MICPDCEQVHDGSLSGVVVRCNYCGTETRKDEYRTERSENLFCSTACHDKWRSENISGSDAGGWEGKTVTVTCDNCGDKTEKYECRTEQSEKDFCNDECYSEWKAETGNEMIGSDNPMYDVTGPDHPSWKGGYDGSWRRTDQWRSTAQKVYERDGYTCQDCGAENVELHAHHIVPVHKGGPKRDLDNIVTLCFQCHHAKHAN